MKKTFVAILLLVSVLVGCGGSDKDSDRLSFDDFKKSDIEPLKEFP